MFVFESNALVEVNVLATVDPVVELSRDEIFRRVQ